MATKCIMLGVADQDSVIAITKTLGTAWMPTPVGSAAEALAQLEKYPFDALLVDFNFGSPDASDLLNQALEKRPQTVRFLLAYEADLALVAAKVLGTHHILPKPIEFASLKRRLEEGVSPEESSRQHPAGDPAAGLSAAPIVPAVYAQVLKALESPEVTHQQVGDIIARDALLAAEVMRLAQSACLVLPRNITSVCEALNTLGLEALKALAMALRFLAENSHLKPGYMSFDKMWQHCTQVAQIARDLVLFETQDRALASQAFVAGLIHDFGKVTLATNFDDLYGRVHSLARKQPVPLWEIEKEMFGASHGEIGGCLVGMWNLPLPIVEAVAYHHEPLLGQNQCLSPLAAVHIANVLQHELEDSDQFRVGPIMDTRVLNELGLLQRLPVWRAALAKGSPPDAEPEPETAAPAPAGSGQLSITTATATASQLPAPTTTTRTSTSGSARGTAAVPASYYRQRRRVYAGVAAAALLLLVTFWYGTRPDAQPPLPVYARTPDAAAAGVFSSPAPGPVPGAVERATPESGLAQEGQAMEDSTAKEELSQPTAEPPGVRPAAMAHETPTNTPPASRLAASAPVREFAPTSAVDVPQATLASVPSPSVARPKEPTPQFRLNGIIFSVSRPQGIVNGKTVFVGSHVDGATVVSIGPNHVTLQIDGQLKTLVPH